MCLPLFFLGETPDLIQRLDALEKINLNYLGMNALMYNFFQCTFELGVSDERTLVEW